MCCIHDARWDKRKSHLPARSSMPAAEEATLALSAFFALALALIVAQTVQNREIKLHYTSFKEYFAVLLPGDLASGKEAVKFETARWNRALSFRQCVMVSDFNKCTSWLHSCIKAVSAFHCVCVYERFVLKYEMIFTLDRWCHRWCRLVLIISRVNHYHISLAKRDSQMYLESHLCRIQKFSFIF